MTTTVAQNQAHRNDAEWIKASNSGASEYISEYRNGFTGQIIRKSCRMTGCDWHIFDTSGQIVGRENTLTFAKLYAAYLLR